MSKKIDLGVQIKILCPNCLSELDSFVHSRFGKVIEICVEPHNCKTNCLSCGATLARGETWYCEDCHEHVVKDYYRKEKENGEEKHD